MSVRDTYGLSGEVLAHRFAPRVSSRSLIGRVPKSVPPVPKTYGTGDTKKMPSKGIEQDAGERFASALRWRYPANTNKHVQRDTGAKYDTVKRWLEGNLPRADVLMSICEQYGVEFTARVWPPNSQVARLAKLDAGFDEIDRRLDGIRAELAELKGQPIGRPQDAD